MPALGPGSVATALTGLDPKLLVRLVRDLFVMRGHTYVRETDGPGDASRDVFSVSRYGRRHLCQCKYHADPAKAVTNNEVGELVLGLLKHGYRSGTFITNARITSAAKRELLDNYPAFEIEFLDGQELFSEVIGNEVLRLLWVEGEKVTLVSTRVALPIIARVHDGDIPFLLQSNDDRTDVLSRTVSHVRELIPGVEVSAGFKFGCPIEAFSPYRPPAYLRLEEGGLDGIAAGEIVLAGRVSASQIFEVARAAAWKAAELLSKRHGAVGVVAGRPFFLSGSGIYSEERMLSGLRGFRCIAVNGSACSEDQWFLPKHVPWSPRCVASTTQTGYVRLYSSKLDAALDYEIEVPVAPWERLHFQRYRDGWERSVFALVEPGTSFSDLGVPEPSASVRWSYENLDLVWWRHEYFFRDGLIALPSVLRDRDDELGFRRDFRAEEAAESARIEKLRQTLAEQGLRLVAPARARFMAALMMDVDPLAEPSGSQFRTGDVFAAFDSIPSPIPPSARHFTAILAWNPSEGHKAETLMPVVRDVLAGTGTTDDVSQDEGYVVLLRRYSNYDALQPTQSVVEEIAADVAGLSRAVEAAICGRATRATRNYWFEMYGVRLGRGRGEPESGDD